ncbi:three-Cys-motif partner protein TcmP [Inquilinus limosus]|uniref:three-Cys-motif partner protein TcmP n=1 Tax=Inquilinus limosus TaxID=171674 RepID=UPI003F149D1C
MSTADHEFGGVSTDLKLSLVEGYLRAFTTALKGKFSELWYIDAFAGTGERTVLQLGRESNLLEPATEERLDRRRGSAQIAIDILPPFHRLIFMDKNSRHCLALNELKSKHQDRNIEIFEGNANEVITTIIKKFDWKNKRAVMFLDPYGMSVNWQTLEAIRSTNAIDIWYLVSLAGLFRQAPHNAAALDESKRTAITRMLGTTDWEQAWYQKLERTDLFGEIDAIHARTADVEAIENYVGDRLRTLFPKVLPPLRLRSDRNVSQFSLFFLISNPENRAIGLATKIANHILNSGRSSQVRPR